MPRWLKKLLKFAFEHREQIIGVAKAVKQAKKPKR
jgi:hypothetical protein